MFRFTKRNESIPLTAWIALGAGAMFLLDPDNGRRRRALLRDKALHAARVGLESAGRAKRDLSNRAHGARVRLRNKVHPEEHVPDEILAERVRAKMGVFVSHPHAITVEARNGIVTLRGPILRREAQALIRRVRHVPGVHEIIDQLERHQATENVSALQGGVARRRRPEFLQENWAPGARLLAGTAGLGLLTLGLSRRRSPLTVAGFAVLLRTLANAPLKQVLSTVRQDVFRKRGAPPPRAAAPVSALPEPAPVTPVEEAEAVARSIRE